MHSLDASFGKLSKLKSAAQWGSHGKGIIRSESFDNDVFFDIEAKRTLSIVLKFISKQSDHVFIKEFKYPSEAK